jgi:hypothetical protein
MTPAADELVELRATMASMAAELQELRASAPRRRLRLPGRRLAAVGGGAVLAAAMLTGVAGASGSSNPDLVTFTPVSPAYKLVTNGSISAHSSKSFTVAGAPTTIPDDATSVELTLSVHGAQNGELTIFPTGNPSDNSQFIDWLAGHSNFGDPRQNVGLKNQVTFANSSAGSAIVTATIIGYSTQVTADGISTFDAFPGEVLVAGPDTAQWGLVGTNSIDPSGGNPGDVLTNDGGGASWAPSTGGTGYVSSQCCNTPVPNLGFGTVDSLTVPAGTYQVSFTAAYRSSASAQLAFQCVIVSPGGFTSAGAEGEAAGPTITVGSLADQMMLQTSGGTIKVNCNAFGTGGGFLDHDTLSAVQLSAANGAVVPQTRHTSLGR